MKKLKSWILVVAAFLGLKVNAQTPSTSLGSNPVPVTLQRSIPGATATPQSGRLPSRVDHRALLPKPGYQDRINSCVGWAAAYAARTFLENYHRGWGTDGPDKIFSPSFVYNLINGGQDRGSSIIHAMDLMRTQGVATLRTMPYTLDFTQQPSTEARREAVRFTAEGYERLDPRNIDSIKAVLASGNVVIFGMRTHENFTQYRGGVYNRVEGANLGGHAMALIGYDDGRQAFLLINSWSERWGEQGYGWIAYPTFAELTHTAVVLKVRPITRPERPAAPSRLEATLGTFADRIQVSWTEVLNAEGYIVFRSESANGPFREIARTEGNVFLDQRAEPGKMYFYSVKSFGAAGESDFSPIATGFLNVPSVLGIPQNVQALPVGLRVRLLWSPVANATGYNIYRFDESVEKFRLIGQSRDQGFEDASLTRGGIYYYAVSAIRGQEESAASQSIGVLVSAPQPLEPTPPTTPQQTPQPAQRPAQPQTPPASPAPTPAPASPSATPQPTPVRGQDPVRLRAVRGARASQGQFSDRIEITWRPVPGAQSYRIEVMEPRQTRYRLVGTSTEPRFVFNTTNTSPHYFAITPVAGQVLGPTVDYILGFTSRQPRRQVHRFADGAYREQFQRDPETIFARSEEFFRNDRFFENSDKFFDSFVPADFFFVDVEKFFAVDENFFDVEDDFFR